MQTLLRATDSIACPVTVRSIIRDIFIFPSFRSEVFQQKKGFPCRLPHFPNFNEKPSTNFPVRRKTTVAVSDRTTVSKSFKFPYFISHYPNAENSLFCHPKTIFLY